MPVMCSLERNEMGSEGAGYLSDALKVNKTLVNLKYAAPLHCMGVSM